MSAVPTTVAPLKKSMVLLNFKAIGEAPALKKTKFKLDGEKIVADVEKFIQKMINHDGALVRSSLFRLQYFDV